MSHDEDGVDQEAQPSHADCPHVSRGTTNQRCSVFLSGFWRTHEEFFCEVLLVLLRPQLSVLECRVFPLSES